MNRIKATEFLGVTHLNLAWIQDATSLVILIYTGSTQETRPSLWLNNRSHKSIVIAFDYPLSFRITG